MTKLWASPRSEWAFYTIAHALASGALALRFFRRGSADITAMLAVVLLFMLVPLATRLWPFFCGDSEWSKSFRVSLKVRSWTCLLEFILILVFQEPFLGIVELGIGIAGMVALGFAVQVTGLHPGSVPWLLTSLVTFSVGLSHLLVVAVLTIVIRVLRY
jgi:hypothetical protein